jgi:hypothetical protein
MSPRKGVRAGKLHVVAGGCLPARRRSQSALFSTSSRPRITSTGYRQPLSWLRGFGSLLLVGVEGTGAYALAWPVTCTPNAPPRD